MTNPLTSTLKTLGFFRGIACGTLLLAAPLLPVNRASAQNASNADAAFNGWCNAFLIRSNGQTYFCNSLSDRSMAYLWGQAYMITTVLDVFDRSPTTANRQLISDLLNTFEQVNGTNLTGDSYDDDLEWCEIALIRGFQVTGNAAYLNAAAESWNDVYNRGYDTTYGGGIWENMDTVPDGGKGCLSNLPQVIAGCMIYEATTNTDYLNKSISLYSWVRSHLFNTSSGRLYEDWNPSGQNTSSDDNSYNSGLFINAANALYRLTGNSQYYNDAVLAANHCVAKYNGTNGIMNEDHPANGSFGCEQFVRGLSKFARENNLWGNYYSFLQNNCTAAWNTRRTDYNISQNNWTTQTPESSSLAGMEAESSVVIQAVTQINPFMGTHMIINQQTGEAVDNGNTAGTANGQNAGVILWSKNSGATQWWNFTQNSDNSWNILSVRSGQALDNASSSSNGTQVIQYYPNTDNGNQRWWVDQQSDGSQKIWNKVNSKSLDNGSKNGNGIPLIQWDWQGSNNPQQRWTVQ